MERSHEQKEDGMDEKAEEGTEEEEEVDGECWGEEDGYQVITTDKGGSEKMSRVDVAVSTTCSTLAEAVDRALETRNFHLVYDLIEVAKTWLHLVLVT